MFKLLEILKNIPFLDHIKEEKAKVSNILLEKKAPPKTAGLFRIYFGLSQLVGRNSPVKKS